MTDSSDDAVGYGRPPRHTQFKKGTSGNPKGKPKRAKSFAADLTSELQETLILTENGKSRRVTKQRAFIKTLTAAAIKKDIRAVNALLACVRYFGLETEDQVAPSADPDDLEILENYIAREKQRNESGGNPAIKTKEENGSHIMTEIVSKIYGRDLLAFIEKAHRQLHGKKIDGFQKYIALIVCVLQQFMCGNIRKLLINLPGRHLKTFICSICLPAFMLGRDPTLKFMIVAYNEEVAAEIVRQIREIMSSSWYKATFSTRIANLSRSDDFTTKGGGRVRAVAVQSITGKGGDIIIFDDGHRVSDWDNDRAKRKVIESFELLVSRRDGGMTSRLLVIGHRVAKDDKSAHIMERGDFEHICLPLYAPKRLTFTIAGQIWTFEKGEALRPAAFPQEEIESLRLYHQGPPFWLYYQQGVGPEDDGWEIEESDFPILKSRLGDILALRSPVVLSVDPAQKTNSSSRNVIHVYAINGEYRDLLDVFAEKCTYKRLLDKTKYLARCYEATHIVVEDTARGSDLMDDLRADLAIPIIAARPMGQKGDRLRKYVKLIRKGLIRIRSLDRVEDAVREIVSYPNHLFDDSVDAFTNMLETLPNLNLQDFVRPRTTEPRGIAVVLGSHRRFGNF